MLDQPARGISIVSMQELHWNLDVFSVLDVQIWNNLEIWVQSCKSWYIP